MAGSQTVTAAWRQLNPGRQALLVLVYLRKGETFAEIAAGFGVSTATAWRYVEETVKLLAARSPKLHHALRKANEHGHAFVVIDGTLIPIDRVAADRPFYSGKHKHHGTNLQVISSPDGTILWVSGALPGSIHDLNAARIWGVLRELDKAGLIVLADKGYIGAGQHVITPYRGKNKPESQKHVGAWTHQEEGHGAVLAVVIDQLDESPLARRLPKRLSFAKRGAKCSRASA